MAPTLRQDWNNHAVASFEAPADCLFTEPPHIGLVIGTFAAVPYIHLQLEARQRFYPQVPLLVHDDGSHKTQELADLCRAYDVDFETNEQRQPPCVGDLTAFIGGLWWAQHRQLDVLLKLSRRWVFLTDWEPSLRTLAFQSQYATFCSYTNTFGFGFRTECLGMSVKVWSKPSFMRSVLTQVQEGRSVFVEGYLHDFARQYERQNCPQAERWREAHPMPADRNGYALWTLMGTDRCERASHFLWHDFAGPQDYFQLAKEWGLPYQFGDFSDPNEGAGTGMAA
jgi:hypothetical protein